jgi:aconitase A
MKYFYLSQYPNLPIADIDNLLNNYEYLGKEINKKNIRFIGKIDGILHRLELEAFDIISNKSEKRIFFPKITELKKPESIKYI